MATNVLGLLRFVHQVRADFFEAAADLGAEEFTRDRGVSLGSFRELFLHLCYVEEQHVIHFAEGEPTLWPDELVAIPKDRWTDIPSVRLRLQEIATLAERKFRRWDSPAGLAESVVWVAGPYPLAVPRDTALMQCATEQLFHLGEVEAMLWQLDVQPPTTMWIRREFLRGKWPPPRSVLWAPPKPERTGRGPPSPRLSPVRRRG
jgi:uncharacterized damage-inducible protein DinB